MDILQLPISSDQTDIVTTEIAEKKSDGRLAREKICTGTGLMKTHTLSPIQAVNIIYQWTNAGTRMLRLK